jgi:hypothetical protein
MEEYLHELGLSTNILLAVGGSITLSYNLGKLV